MLGEQILLACHSGFIFQRKMIISQAPMTGVKTKFILL